MKRGSQNEDQHFCERRVNWKFEVVEIPVEKQVSDRDTSHL